MTENKRHVALMCSYKFEDANLLLELLKLNFKNPPYIHFFCNLNKTSFDAHKNILNFDLIDKFYYVPDPQCSPQNHDFQSAKRNQPLKIFAEVTAALHAHDAQQFALLESDNYPLSEDRFNACFDKISADDIDVLANKITNFNDIDLSNITSIKHLDVLKGIRDTNQMRKMPAGYIATGSIFMKSHCLMSVATYIKQHLHSLLDGRKNYEGCLGVIFNELGLRRKNCSDYFCCGYPDFAEVDPALHISHQHNIFALKDELISRNMTRGTWVQRVINDTSYVRNVDGVHIKRDESIVLNYDAMKICDVD